MELQNIVINFTDRNLKSLVDGKLNEIEILFDFDNFKTLLNSNCDFAVYQITQDQHESEKRFILNSNDGSIEIRNLSTIESENISLFNEINNLESECLNYLNV